MNRLTNASIQLCSKCFNFLQVKALGSNSRVSCSSCSILRFSSSCNYGSTFQLSRKSHSLSNEISTEPKFNYMKPRSHNFMSSFENRFQFQNSSSYSTSPPNPLPPRKKSKGDSQKSPISWRNLLIVSGIGGSLLLGMNFVKKEKEQERQKVRNKKMGKAKLGGEWTLIDHHGKVRSSRDFLGQWLLIYFGFTNCPDICPEEIEKIVSVISKTDADPVLPKIQPVVITVDPDRDTPAALKEYCAEFSPRLLGFSGSQEQIHEATRAYRVYYSMGPKDEDNDYIVDHSIISYLINPQGDFVDYFGQNKKDEEIYKSIKLHIMAYEKQNK